MQFYWGDDMIKNKRKVNYKGIFLAAVIIILVGAVFAKIFYNSSQNRVLDTLGELSDQEAQVILKEVEKGKQVLVNLAVYIGQDETVDVDNILERLKALDQKNHFKRMGLIFPNGRAYTTDDKVLDLYGREYFKRSMEGETVISDTLLDLNGGGKINVYSTPVTFKDGSKCVLFATYEMEQFEEILSADAFGGEGWCYIIGNSGKRIAGDSTESPEKSRAGSGADSSADSNADNSADNSTESSMESGEDSIEESRGDNREDSGLGNFNNIFQVLNGREGENEEAIACMKSDMTNGGRGNVLIRGRNECYIYYQPLGVNDWYLLNVVPVSLVEKDINGQLVMTYLFAVICMAAILILLLNTGRVRKRSQEEIEHAAFVDDITGGGTFAKFKIDAERILAQNRGKKYAVVSLNVLKFQYVNDLFGYGEGNDVLRHISETFSKNLKEDESIGRREADHFIVLLRRQSREELRNRIEELIEECGAFFSKEKRDYEIKMLAGIYEIEDNITRIEVMADRADMALSREDRGPFEICAFYDDTIRNKKIQEKEIEDSFESALARREFVVYYQPKFDIRAGRFYGAEALIRWDSPEKGLIAPNAFIHVFEGNGTIVRMDQYIFEEVCRQIARWLEMGYEVTPVSVNVSRVHLYRKDFVDSYLEIINKYRVPVELIQLELTETVLFDNGEILANILGEFRKMGIRILMDDFGSGYSSIAMLKELPIDELKLDKTLVEQYDASIKGQKILKSITELSHELDLKVVAEGVETKEEYDFLEKINCDYIQGYYCAKPMPVAEYEEKVLDKTVYLS